MDDIVAVSQEDGAVVEKQPSPVTEIGEDGGTSDNSTSIGCFPIQEFGQIGENQFLFVYISRERRSKIRLTLLNGS